MIGRASPRGLNLLLLPLQLSQLAHDQPRLKLLARFLLSSINSSLQPTQGLQEIECILVILTTKELALIQTDKWNVVSCCSQV